MFAGIVLALSVTLPETYHYISINHLKMDRISIAFYLHTVHFPIRQGRHNCSQPDFRRLSQLGLHIL